MRCASCGVDALRTQHEPHRFFHRQLAGEALQRAATERREPHARLGKPELGVLRGDREIAGGEDFHAAAQAQPVDRGDHRLPQVESMRDAGKARRRLFVVARRRQRLEIGADAERAVARAGDDGHAQLGISGIVVERLRKLAVARGVHGVQHLGPIQRDRDDVAVALDAAIFVCRGHRRSQ